MSEQQIQALYEINESLTGLANSVNNKVFERYRDSMPYDQQKNLILVQDNIVEASSLNKSLGQLPKKVLQQLQRYLPPEIDDYLHDAMFFLNRLPHDQRSGSIKYELEKIQKNMAIVRSKTMSLNSNLPNQYFVQTCLRNSV